MSAWLRAAARLRAERTPAALVTVVSVRGHAPREAGAKMVVAADGVWGSIGGGNLEERAVRRARAMVAALAGGEHEPVVDPVVERVSLSDKAPVEHGVQCCGGEVTYLVEPLPVPPSIALFGLGHVGLELALLLSRHDVDLHVVDSRPDQLAEERLALLALGEAEVHAHAVPVLPELVLADLPAGTHVLVLTHDHAEDLAILDAALRLPALGPLGVIGSSAKWTRFRAALLAAGHDVAAVDAVRSPIGTAGLGPPGKTPAAIALAVATEVLAGATSRSHHP